MEKVADPDEFFDDTLFVSKVGGKPAWPDLRTLPIEQSCKKCGKPLVFLLQIHSPLSTCGQERAEDVPEDPRTLFLFMCRELKCHSPGDSGCFQVLRYESGGSEFGPNDLSPSLDACTSSTSTHTNMVPIAPHCDSSKVKSWSHEDTSSLCAVCGGRGTKRCGNCRTVNYCSKHHQIHDWKLGHRKNCTNPTQSPPTLTYDPSSGVVLSEWEVVTEPEPEGCDKEEERSEEERMKAYKEYIKQNVKGGAKWSEEEGTVGKGEVTVGKGGREEEDKVFRNFMERIAVERQQVQIKFNGAWALENATPFTLLERGLLPP